MAELKIILGNKNYSSWSLRAWLALAHTGADFEEVVIPLDRDGTAASIQAWSPAGKVPILRDGDEVIWDSLAICEYLAERFPEAGLWPKDRAARALARSACAEMHAGFAALRRALPMDVRSHVPLSYDAAVGDDIARICAIWSQCRGRFGGDGPYLFGAFTIADAFFAPVASRFATYAVDLPNDAKRYVGAVLEEQKMRAWRQAAADEPWVIEAP